MSSLVVVVANAKVPTPKKDYFLVVMIVKFVIVVVLHGVAVVVAVVYVLRPWIDDNLWYVAALDRPAADGRSPLESGGGRWLLVAPPIMLMVVVVVVVLAVAPLLLVPLLLDLRPLLRRQQRPVVVDCDRRAPPLHGGLGLAHGDGGALTLPPQQHGSLSHRSKVLDEEKEEEEEKAKGDATSGR